MSEPTSDGRISSAAQSRGFKTITGRKSERNVYLVSPIELRNSDVISKVGKSDAKGERGNDDCDDANGYRLSRKNTTKGVVALVAKAYQAVITSIMKGFNSKAENKEFRQRKEGGGGFMK